MKKYVLTLVLGMLFFTAYSQEQKDRELVLEDYLIAATIYHDNGEISQKGFYNLDGKPHGKWIAYNPSGDLTSVAEYNNGKKIGTWYFYEGENLREVSYENNKIIKTTLWKTDENQLVSKF